MTINEWLLLLMFAAGAILLAPVVVKYIADKLRFKG